MEGLTLTRRRGDTEIERGERTRASLNTGPAELGMRLGEVYPPGVGRTPRERRRREPKGATAGRLRSRTACDRGFCRIEKRYLPAGW